MKYLVFAFILVIVISGCELGEKTPKAPKILDWNKTASEQKFKIGDTIIVEGLAFNIVEYEYEKRKVIGDGVFAKPYIKPATLKIVKWTDQISVPLYNPEQSNVTVNPNVPIGSVICTIYNPNLNDDLRTLLETSYPWRIKQESKEDTLERSKVEQYIPDYYQKITARPNIQHRFRFTGSIQNIGRKTVRGVSLQCVDIAVSALTVVSSKRLDYLHLVPWLTEPPFYWPGSEY